MDFKFKKNAVAETDELYYDLFDGFIKPEELLDDDEQIFAVTQSIEVIKKFIKQAKDIDAIVICL